MEVENKKQAKNIFLLETAWFYYAVILFPWGVGTNGKFFHSIYF